MAVLHGFEKNQNTSEMTSKSSGVEEVDVCGQEVLSSVMSPRAEEELENFAEIGVHKTRHFVLHHKFCNTFILQICNKHRDI